MDRARATPNAHTGAQIEQRVRHRGIARSIERGREEERLIRVETRLLGVHLPAEERVRCSEQPASLRLYLYTPGRAERRHVGQGLVERPVLAPHVVRRALEVKELVWMPPGRCLEAGE